MKNRSLNAQVFSLLLILKTAFTAAAPISLLPLNGYDLITHQNVFVDSSKKTATVVVFLSALCPCSNSHLPELRKLSENFPEFNFVAIHSNANESLGVSQAYFKKANLSFPVIEDEHSKLANQFKAFKTPHAFVVLANGELAYQGGVSNSVDFPSSSKLFLREALMDLKNHQNVRTSSGRTLGCMIKRT